MIKASDESLRLSRLEGIAENQNHTISSQEHFGNESVLVNWFPFLLAFTRSWILRPHFLNVLQHHITMSVKSFDTGQELPIIPAVDQHLCVILDGLCQDR